MFTFLKGDKDPGISTELTEKLSKMASGDDVTFYKDRCTYESGASSSTGPDITIQKRSKDGLSGEWFNIPENKNDAIATDGDHDMLKLLKNPATVKSNRHLNRSSDFHAFPSVGLSNLDVISSMKTRCSRHGVMKAPGHPKKRGASSPKKNNHKWMKTDATLIPGDKPFKLQRWQRVDTHMTILSNGRQGVTQPKGMPDAEPRASGPIFEKVESKPSIFEYQELYKHGIPETAPEDAPWSIEETNLLFELAHRFDQRWHVVHDRFTMERGEKGPERSVEDVRLRFYAVSGSVSEVAAKTKSGDTPWLKRPDVHPMATASDVSLTLETSHLYTKSMWGNVPLPAWRAKRTLVDKMRNAKMDRRHLEYTKILAEQDPLRFTMNPKRKNKKIDPEKDNPFSAQGINTAIKCGGNVKRDSAGVCWASQKACPLVPLPPNMVEHVNAAWGALGLPGGPIAALKPISNKDPRFQTMRAEIFSDGARRSFTPARETFYGGDNKADNNKMIYTERVADMCAAVSTDLATLLRLKRRYEKSIKPSMFPPLND